MEFPQERADEILTLFKGCYTSEERVHKLISLGRELPPFPPNCKIDDYLVPGCQSIVYLHSTIDKGKIFFTAYTEALISAGLAVLLIRAYSGLTPDVVLKIKPHFLEDLGIYTSLSPGRSNGLSSMVLTIQKRALHSLMSCQSID